MAESRKGIPNKNRDFLLKRLKDMYGQDFDPVMKAAENAHSMQKIANAEESKALEPKDRIEMHNKTNQAWDRVAQYTQPKLKAVEITGDIELSAHESWLEKLAE